MTSIDTEPVRNGSGSPAGPDAGTSTGPDAGTAARDATSTHASDDMAEIVLRVRFRRVGRGMHPRRAVNRISVALLDRVARRVGATCRPLPTRSQD